MHAALQVAPAADTMTLPLVVTVALATVALVVVAAFVRRARRNGRLDRTTAAAGSVSAAGILAIAIMVGLSLAGPSVASAAPQDVPVPSDVLSGFQLPTQ